MIKNHCVKTFLNRQKIHSTTYISLYSKGDITKNTNYQILVSFDISWLRESLSWLQRQRVIMSNEGERHLVSGIDIDIVEQKYH